MFACASKRKDSEPLAEIVTLELDFFKLAEASNQYLDLLPKLLTTPQRMLASVKPKEIPATRATQSPPLSTQDVAL